MSQNNDGTSSREGRFCEPCDRVSIREVERLYPGMKTIAHALMRNERDGHTLCTTALTNETLLKLMGSDPNRIARWEDPRQFLFAFARAARNVLVSYARRRNAARREGAWQRVEYNDAIAMADRNPVELCRIDELLGSITNAVELPDPARAQRILVLRFFVGLSVEETAAVVEVSTATVKRDWAAIERWLKRELGR